VHEDFRVIATGLPVPAFAGFPLDPPLRSRFQGAFIGVPPAAAQLASLRAALGPADASLSPRAAAEWRRLAPRLVGWCEAVRACAAAAGGDGQAEGRLLHLSHGAMQRAARVLRRFPTHYDLTADGGGQGAAGAAAETDGAGNAVVWRPAALPALLGRAYPAALMGLDAPESAGLRAAYESAGMGGVESGPEKVQGRFREGSGIESGPESSLGSGLGGGMDLSVGEIEAGGSLPPLPPLLSAVLSHEGSAARGDWVETPALRGSLAALVEDHDAGAATV
jgi:hypothetical protein